MKPLLRNPVYHSLLYNDAPLGNGANNVKWFHPDVSPFAGFEEGYPTGFEELYEALPEGRRILYATPLPLATPKGWKLAAAVQGLQFLYEGGPVDAVDSFNPSPLGPQQAEEMVALATLTKPGPFGPRTIEFGHYHGVFEEGKLAAMTGQRLHVKEFTEVSAVCTHPDALGKGYATALVRHQVNLILGQGCVPFLHVRTDNKRAIAVYRRLGFVEQGPMNFYFLKKEPVGPA